MDENTEYAYTIGARKYIIPDDRHYLTRLEMCQAVHLPCNLDITQPQ